MFLWWNNTNKNINEDGSANPLKSVQLGKDFSLHCHFWNKEAEDEKLKRVKQWKSIICIHSNPARIVTCAVHEDLHVKKRFSCRWVRFHIAGLTRVYSSLIYTPVYCRTPHSSICARETGAWTNLHLALQQNTSNLSVSVLKSAAVKICSDPEPFVKNIYTFPTGAIYKHLSFFSHFLSSSSHCLRQNWQLFWTW